MIKTTFVYRWRDGVKQEYKVILTVTGSADLAHLAASIERNGNATLAAAVRRSKRFSTTMTPEQFKRMEAGS